MHYNHDKLKDKSITLQSAKIKKEYVHLNSPVHQIFLLELSVPSALKILNLEINSL